MAYLDEISVITVRMPPSLHEAVKEAAHQRRLSMNEFCIQALEVPLKDALAKAMNGDDNQERSPSQDANRTAN